MSEICCEGCGEGIVRRGTITRLQGQWICYPCRNTLAFLYTQENPHWLDNLHVTLEQTRKNREFAINVQKMLAEGAL